MQIRFLLKFFFLSLLFCIFQALFWDSDRIVFINFLFVCLHKSHKLVVGHPICTYFFPQSCSFRSLVCFLVSLSVNYSTFVHDFSLSFLPELTAKIQLREIMPLPKLSICQKRNIGKFHTLSISDINIRNFLLFIPCIPVTECNN